ncbi:TetR family transcriptional repressor PsrA [Bowmanella dokdonensis]|uniref:TetR family transcriptional regulator n=1 Tax=Bowmanella dokdonensis TaxID=751969 RepID=A0A939DQG2_9ALTE|nr:TetR/AcrR family transcriptional regulator [Bowmanella dokdonensis]MBN7826869.1 TetR family transcriptional regulator [Bowmanella dokdonensis]
MSAETKTEILNAAESLFAEHGFGDTSLRAITSQAKVNLASVNYHFGSKKQLIQEVLQRYLRILMPAVDQQLKQLLAQHPQPSVDQVFSSLVQPLLLLNQVRPNGTAIFVRLLGRGYSESQGHLRKYITHHYGASLQRFVNAVHLAVPQLSAAEIFWRLHFAIGTFVFTMASSKALSEIALADYQQQVNVEGIIHRLMPYISAGVGAPASAVQNPNPMLDIA